MKRVPEQSPPRLAIWLLEHFCSYDFKGMALWELDELYQYNRSTKGQLRADLICYKDALSVVFHLFFKGKSQYSSNNTFMLKNNLVVAVRSLWRDKSYAGLNVLGLLPGLILFMMLALYAADELSYDRYHEKADRLYRVYKQDIGNEFQGSSFYAVTPAPLAPTMKRDYPEVEEAARVNSSNNRIVKAGEELYLESKIYMADPEIFDLLSLDLIVGNRKTVLQGPDAAVISEKAALKYFGKTDVLGEVIYLRNEFPARITGVIANMPGHSHFVMDVIFNFEGIIGGFRDRPLDHWNNSSYQSFVLLTEGANADELAAKLPELRAKYADDPIDDDGQETVFYLQPITEMHFTQAVNFDIAPSTNKGTLYTYLAISVLILIIAMMNYINLATARAINKTRQIGIRKVIGAGKVQLMIQLFAESAVLVYLTMAVSLGLLFVTMPFFSGFIGKTISVPWTELPFWVVLMALGLVMTLLSGFYPAWLLGSLKPLAALNGNSKSAKSGTAFRNVLGVIQFAVSGLRIMGAVFMSRQVDYILTMDTGFDKDQIIVMGIREDKISENMDVFKAELRKVPGVLHVSSSNSLPNDVDSNTGVQWVGKKESDPDMDIYTTTADASFMDLYGLEIVEGRNFNDEMQGGERGVVLNEAAVRMLGWENPFEMRIPSWYGDTARVVGIVKDFHQHSVHLDIVPVQIFQGTNQFFVSIKIEGENSSQVLKDIEAKYEEFSPVYPFDFQYFNDIFDRAYLTEIKAGQLARWFTGLAILIACLGLYGQVIHKVQNRIKEIGVRKVLGASVSQLLRLLSREFALMITLSFLISAPVAYWLMNSWLDGFAYHVDISIWSFVLALLAMLLAACLTIGFRTWRSATGNPVQALRED